MFQMTAMQICYLNNTLKNTIPVIPLLSSFDKLIEVRLFDI